MRPLTIGGYRMLCKKCGKHWAENHGKVGYRSLCRHCTAETMRKTNIFFPNGNATIDNHDAYLEEFYAIKQRMARMQMRRYESADCKVIQW